MYKMATSLKELESGKKKFGNSFQNDNSRAEVPPWFERNKFDRGRKFYSDFLVPVIFANFLALLVGFTVETFQKVLIATKESEGAKKSMIRYTKTLHHLFLWHDTDIFDPTSAGFRSLHFVRKWHDSVRRKLETDSDQPLMNQYDFSLVQAGFVGPIVMYPKDLGIVCDRRYLQDYVYFWRVLGYSLGIDDYYNICSQGLETAQKICRDITDEIIVPGLRLRSPEYEMLAQDFIDGVRFRNPLCDRDVLYAYIYPNMGLTPPKLSFKQWFLYYFLVFHFWLIAHWTWFREFSNEKVKRIILETMKNECY